jgi:hypothetical protein
MLNSPRLPPTFALLGALVCVALIAWNAAQSHLASPAALASSMSYVALPLVVRLEQGELERPPALAATGTATSAPSPTPTNTPSATPTLPPTPVPTNSPECEQQIEQSLQGRLRAEHIGEITNSSTSCTYAVGLAAYRMFDEKLSHQQLFSSQTAMIAPGQTLTLTVDLPGCAYQIDLFHGRLIEVFDPGRGEFYGERILASRVVRDAGFCAPGSPTATSTATPEAPATPTETPATPTETPDGGS